MTRSRASARAAGTRFETLIANWLAERFNDDRIERRARFGAKDRGDIGGVRTVLGARIVVECKDTNRLELSGWVREADIERGNDDALVGVVVHKKRGTSDPAEQYVTMRLADFAHLVEGGRP